MSQPSRRRAQADSTRARLVTIARRHFAERGYADASTVTILADAGLARGGLYHHFPDKRALFRAVFERVEEDLVDEVVRAAYAEPAAPLPERLPRGVRAFLAAAARPEVQRIVLTDAPAVLGQRAWRELDDRYGLRLIRRVLRQGVAEGVLPERPVRPTARLLLAALNEAASVVAQADDPAAAIDEMTDAVLALFGPDPVQ